MIRTIAGQIKQYKVATILTPLFTALEVVMEVLIPFIMSKLIDEGIQAQNMKAVYFYGGTMILMAMFSLMFGALAGVFAARASSGLACNLRESMYEGIQRFSFANIDKYSTAGLVTRMTTDVTNVQQAFQMIMRIAVRAPFMLISSLAMCIIIQPELSFIFAIAAAFLAIALSIIVKATMKIFDVAFKKYDDLNASVQENVSAIRVVKAYVREEYESSKFQKASDALYRMFVKAEKNLAFNSPVMMTSFFGCIIALSWFGAKRVVVGNMTTGQLTSMFSYVMGILMSLMMITVIFVMLTMSAASAKRIVEVLTEKPSLTNPENPVMTVANGAIDFEHVSFSYKKGSGEDTLKDIDLHIKSGETIGIIGSTGCGKSSFANLISRLYDVQEGCVKVGGIDVRDYDMEVLRNQVAVVLQKNVLFSGTILENLRWGDENATDEQCMEACRQACADEFIQSFPDKYNTYIEQGGTNVSGGQKQRLCIARALLKKPQVLILDDSTSAVDTATDAKIRKTFKETIPGVTKLIIAQRISSVKDADRILVLEDGKVDGFDTHENLLKTNDIYKEIYEVQSQGSGDFDEQAER